MPMVTPSSMVSEGIASVGPDQLKPGALWDLFSHGARVVVLRDDQRIERLWSQLIEGGGDNPRLPWDQPLLDLARNHRSRDVRHGDMFRFLPGIYSHVARKFKIYPAPETNELLTYPPFFRDGNECGCMSPVTIGMAWELASQIFTSCLPVEARPPKVAVTCELLKYPDSTTDLTAINDLLKDSSGKWSRLGRQVDANRSMARGPFDQRIVRDLFGLGCLVPVLGRLLIRCNARWARGELQHDPGASLLGRDHVDVSKYINAIASDRDVVQTEFLTGTGWVPMPLASNSFVIFPNLKMQEMFGVPATRHRILLRERQAEVLRSNIRMILAISDLPPSS